MTGREKYGYAPTRCVVAYIASRSETRVRVRQRQTKEGGTVRSRTAAGDTVEYEYQPAQVTHHRTAQRSAGRRTQRPTHAAPDATAPRRASGSAHGGARPDPETQGTHTGARARLRRRATQLPSVVSVRVPSAELPSSLFGQTRSPIELVQSSHGRVKPIRCETTLARAAGKRFTPPPHAAPRMM